MVLSKPENKHVMKQFDLHGKVIAVTGEYRSTVLIGSPLTALEAVREVSASKWPEALPRQALM